MSIFEANTHFDESSCPEAALWSKLVRVWGFRGLGLEGLGVTGYVGFLWGLGFRVLAYSLGLRACYRGTISISSLHG